MDVNELIQRAIYLYELSLDALERDDYVDACEKAWGCVETIRKAFLVKAGISYNLAKSIAHGIPIFTRLLKKLGRKNLLEKYTYFNYKLHIMGFYEGITEPWEIKEIIQNDIKKWIESMKSLIAQLNINLSDAEEIIIEMDKVKRKLIVENAKLFSLRERLDMLIDKAVSSSTQS